MFQDSEEHKVQYLKQIRSMDWKSQYTDVVSIQ
jgi:hypothetical protein